MDRDSKVGVGSYRWGFSNVGRLYSPGELTIDSPGPIPSKSGVSDTRSDRSPLLPGTTVRWPGLGSYTHTPPRMFLRSNSVVSIPCLRNVSTVIAPEAPPPIIAAVTMLVGWGGDGALAEGDYLRTLPPRISPCLSFLHLSSRFTISHNDPTIVFLTGLKPHCPCGVVVVWLGGCRSKVPHPAKISSSCIIALSRSHKPWQSHTWILWRR